MYDSRAIWDVLSDAENTRIPHRIIESIKSCKCVLGYTPQTATRFVQLDLPAGVPNYRASIRRTQAIHVARLPLPHGGSSLILLLEEPGLSDVFALFVDDLLQHLEATSTPEEAAATLYDRFEHWHQLFSRLSSDIIGLEKQRGLFGELTMLKLLLDRHGDAEDVWNSWRGPLSANHDFSSAGVAMEVKTTAAGQPLMHISNELQLDPTGWSTLVLCLVHLAEVRGRADTLSSLLNEMTRRSRIRPGTNALFRSKLTKIGVAPQHYDLFTEHGYEVRSITCYHVATDFPAIRRSDLAHAIGKVTYELHPAGCMPFDVPLDRALDLFRTS